MKEDQVTDHWASGQNRTQTGPGPLASAPPGGSKEFLFAITVGGHHRNGYRPLSNNACTLSNSNNKISLAFMKIPRANKHERRYFGERDVFASHRCNPGLSTPLRHLVHLRSIAPFQVGKLKKFASPSTLLPSPSWELFLQPFTQHERTISPIKGGERKGNGSSWYHAYEYIDSEL